MRRRSLVGFILGLCAMAASVLTYGLAAPNEKKSGEKRPGEKKLVESLLPAEAAIYLGWEGTDSHKEAWEKSAAYESLEKSGFLGTLKNLALSYGATENKQEAAALDDLVKSVARKGFSAAVTLPFGLDEPRIIVVLHGGASLEPALRSILFRMAGGAATSEAQAIRGRTVSSTEGVPPISWWTEGGHLAIGYGAGVVEFALDVADGQRSAITSDASWKKCHENRGDFEMAFCAWVDAAGFVRRYENTAFDGQQNSPKFSSIFKLMGIDKLGTLTWRYGFRDRVLHGEIQLEAPAPRTGLVSLLDQRPISLKDLPQLPAKTSGFTLVSFNWSKAFDEWVKEMKELLGLQLPNGDAQVDEMLESAKQSLGFDLKQDLFDALGDVVCLYGDVSSLPVPVSMGLAIRVKNPEKLQRAAQALVRAADAKISDMVTISTEERHGRRIYVLDFGSGSPVRPAVCVDKQWLFVGLSMQGVESALLRVDGKQQSWKPSATEQAALDGAPKEFLAMNLSDPRPNYASITTLAPLAITFLEGKILPAGEPGRMSAQRLSLLAKLPSPATITRPQFPNISTWTVDDRGLHVKSRRSVPSIFSTAAVAFGGPLLLPSVGWARDSDRVAKSKNHLKQILLACHNYHDVNQSFPQGTRTNGKLKPSKRLSWQADLLPYLEQGAVYSHIDFEKSWDDKANQLAVTTPIEIFLNPGVSQEKTGDTVTHYVGLAGIGAAGPTLPAKNPKAGVFAYDRVTSLQDITDGTSNTAMVSEASKDYGSWAAGGRPTIRSLTKQPYFNGPDGIGGPFRGGCHIGFADGSVRFVSTKIDSKVFEAMVTIAGGENVDLSSIDAK